MAKPPKIVQLTSAAPGFYAEYAVRDEPNHYGPIVAWVLVEDDKGHRWVEGVDPTGPEWDGSPAERASNFVGYVPVDKLPPGVLDR